MKPILPRPLLWTEIKTTREFLDGDYFCPILFDMYSYFYRSFISPQKNNVKFLNEFYYQLTRVYYEKPSYDEFDIFINDITKDIGRQPRADLLLVMIYHYIRLRDGDWTANEISLLNAIKERLSPCRCWAKFESINLPPRIPHHSKIDPRRPSPVSPWELMGKKIDWKEVTLFYHVGTIKEIIMLWENQDDKSMVAAMIEKSMNKIQMIYPHHELDFQIVRDYFRREKLIDDSAALDPLVENQKLKAKLERLEKKNRELEQQHEEDDARMLSGFGAPVVEVYEPGRPVARYITNISNVNTNSPQVTEKSVPLQDILATKQAIQYWEQLKSKNFVDGHYMLLKDTTRQQAAYIADAFSEKLGIKAKWKTFQEFWNIKNLAQEIYQMKQIGKLPSRAKEIDAIFED